MSSERPSRADQLLGQIAIKMGLITKEQLAEALGAQRTAPDHRPLGDYLVERKLIQKRDLLALVEEQKRLVRDATARIQAAREDNLFGKVALRLGYCNDKQIAECLTLQEQLPHDRFMRLGDIMVIKGYLTVEKVRKILDTQKGLILYCSHCDTQYNMVLFRPGVSIQCYKCGSPLRVPPRNTSKDMDQVLYFGEE